MTDRERDLEKLLRQARDEIALLTEGDDCDYSVGICMCGTRQLLTDIGVAVGEVCGDCNGEGHQYVEEEIRDWNDRMPDLRRDWQADY